MYSCDIVKSLLELNDLAGLKKANADLLKQLKVVHTRALSSEELSGAISSTNSTRSRNIGADIYMPNYVRQQKKKCTLIH